MFKKVFNSLKKQEKINLLLISFLTFLSILFELFGISLIIPISKLILDPEFYSQLSEEYGYIDIIKELDKGQIIIIIIISFFIILILKTIFFSILSYSKFNFINKLIKEKTIELYSVYLKQKITFFNNNHSSKLIKNLITEMFSLSAFFNALIILFSELLFSTIIVLGIIFYSPLIFFYLFIYGVIIYYSYKLIFKDKIYSWGNERQDLQEKITKDITESFGALKELILYNTTEIFEKRIQNHFNIKKKLDVRFSTINEIPKYFIELAALIGFFFISYILYFGGTEKSSLLVTLIFSSALLFKGMPSLSRIINSIQQIKFYYPAHELIYDQLSLKNKIKKTIHEDIYFNEAIKLNHLSFSYGDNSILNEISIEIKKGERVLILGKSGKGKSTLIDIIAGFHENFKGEFLVDGKSIKSLVNWRKKIGYLSQSFFILDDSIKNNIILDQEFDEKKFNHIINVCNLKRVLDKKIKGINELIGERGVLLSGGEKQRIGLARALYRNPEILILDEPTSSLDKETADEFINSLLNLDNRLTIIMVTHDKSYLNKFNKKLTL